MNIPISPMATLSFATTFHGSLPVHHKAPLHHPSRNRPSRWRTQVSLPNHPEEEGERKKEERIEKEKKVPLGKKFLLEAEKVREVLRPRQKGDWKDVMLMSLSFAVYVYISQRIVCAYCAWMDMLHHQF